MLTVGDWYVSGISLVEVDAVVSVGAGLPFAVVGVVVAVDVSVCLLFCVVEVGLVGALVVVGVRSSVRVSGPGARRWLATICARSVVGINCAAGGSAGLDDAGRVGYVEGMVGRRRSLCRDVGTGSLRTQRSDSASSAYCLLIRRRDTGPTTSIPEQVQPPFTASYGLRPHQKFATDQSTPG